jgi:hypothetical protein
MFLIDLKILMNRPSLKYLMFLTNLILLKSLMIRLVQMNLMYRQYQRSQTNRKTQTIL